MTGGVPPLTPALLDAYAGRLRGLGVPAVAHLRPGLASAAIERVLAPSGLRLPPEAAIWWEWRNGTAAGAATSPAEREITASRSFPLALEQAVAEAARSERILRDTRLGQEDVWWPGLLPVLSAPHGALVAVDCAAPATPTSIVYSVDWERGTLPKAASLGQVVTWWIDAVDTGAYGFDATAGTWTYDWERLTPAQKASTLV
ncbi:MAG TPA: hypothetical protein VF533_25140 [Solirubrobacteraceae bacterium]